MFVERAFYCFQIYIMMHKKANADLGKIPKMCSGFFVHHYVNLKTIECTLYEHSIVMNYLLQNPFCIFCIRIILLQNCDRQFLFSHALRLPHQNLSGNPRLLIQNRLRFPFHGLWKKELSIAILKKYNHDTEYAKRVLQ